METKLNSDIDSWISVGNGIVVGNRVLYNIARISVFKGIGGILRCENSPVALLIREPDNIYAISFSREELEIRPGTHQHVARIPLKERIPRTLNCHEDADHHPH
jgi:hypothetical protein